MAGEADDLMTQQDVLNDFDSFLGNIEPPAKEPKETKADVKGDDNEPESGESESDVEQDEAESDGDDKQDDAEDEADEETPQRFRLKVDGTDVEVTLDELQNGYSREADYRRKTQAHADEVRKWTAERDDSLKADRTALAAEREQYKSVLGVWEQQLKQALGSDEGLEQLRAQNPGEWSARMTERYELHNRLSAVQAEQAKLADADKSKRDTEFKQKTADEARKLFEAIPEWKDQAAFQRDSKQIYEYAKTVGLSADEINNAAQTDHRIARVLRDASAYRALQEKKPVAQKRIEAVKPLPPGPATLQSTPASKLMKLRDDQAKRGDKKSTIALFEAELSQASRQRA